MVGGGGSDTPSPRMQEEEGSVTLPSPRVERGRGAAITTSCLTGAGLGTEQRWGRGEQQSDRTSGTRSISLQTKVNLLTPQ